MGAGYDLATTLNPHYDHKLEAGRCSAYGRVAQLVRALLSHSRGPGFESLRDHSKGPVIGVQELQVELAHLHPETRHSRESGNSC
jgi:hypothetical protein